MVLFGILFFWQIPHFLAIALFRKEDYARAGLKVMPNSPALRATKHGIVGYLLALVAASLLVVPLGVAHSGYLVVAALLGAIFFGWGCYGLRESASAVGALALRGLDSLPRVVVLRAHTPRGAVAAAPRSGERCKRERERTRV